MLASLTGLLLTLGGEGPAIVFIPPLDPEIVSWNPEELTLSLVESNCSEGPQVCFSDEQSLVVLRPVYFLSRFGCRLDGGDGGTFPCFNCIDSTPFDGSTLIRPQVRSIDKIVFGGLESDCGENDIVFLEGEDLLNSVRRTDEMLSRLESLEQKVESLEQSLESCQCASDLDGDGAVGFNDLVQLISDWGPCSA